MSEQDSAAEELVVLLTGIPVTSWSAQERVICCRIEVFRQGTFASGRMAGLMEAAKLVRAEKADQRVADSMENSLSFDTFNVLLETVAQQIEQAAQEATQPTKESDRGKSAPSD